MTAVWFGAARTGAGHNMFKEGRPHKIAPDFINKL